MELLQSFLREIDCNSWVYKEGKNRNLFALETLCEYVDFDFNPSNLSAEEKLFYVKGFFDAEGGVPRNGKRFYIQFAQKSYRKIERIRDILNEFRINCGKIHNPSEKVDPDYWRIFIRSDSHKKFIKVVGSLHPIKSVILVERMVI